MISLSPWIFCRQISKNSFCCWLRDCFPKNNNTHRRPSSFPPSKSLLPPRWGAKGFARGALTGSWGTLLTAAPWQEPGARANCGTVTAPPSRAAGHCGEGQGHRWARPCKHLPPAPRPPTTFGPRPPLGQGFQVRGGP